MNTPVQGPLKGESSPSFPVGLQLEQGGSTVAWSKDAARTSRSTTGIKLMITHKINKNLLIVSLVCLGFPAGMADAQEAVWPAKTYYRHRTINGNRIFYREAGDPTKPTIILLHGYPSSSHTYRELIPLLSGRYHVVAPDNLGSGYSDRPDPAEATYTFDLLADHVEGLINTLGIDKYVIYMQDFGAPVGYRVMMRQPGKLRGLIVQNANAYMDGLTEQRRAFFKEAHEDRSAGKIRQLRENAGRESIVNRQYLRDVRGREEIVSPDSWTHDLTFLQTDKDREIQVQLFQDYYNNLLAYPKWQAFLREHRPPTLITWGKNDPAFIEAGARAYLRDLPDAELHLIDAGHFAVEEKPVEIARHIVNFMSGLKE
jgi:pimeloyl-ACP methyl ester carboxylesterase